MHAVFASAPHASRSRSFSVARVASTLLALALFGLGWLFIAEQSRLLWQRLPAQTVERFVADQVGEPLPALPAASELKLACRTTLSAWAQVRRAWMRGELATCLSTEQGLQDGDDAQAAITHYKTLITAQTAAASAWLAAYDAKAAAIHKTMAQELAALQGAPAQWQLPWHQLTQGLLAEAPTTTRESVGRTAPADAAARALRAEVAHTQARVLTIAASSSSDGAQARDLALLATGLQLVTDYGHAPLQAHLSSDNHTLADALEWARRGQGYAQRGFSLTRLHALPVALFAASLLLLVVVTFTSRANAAVMLAWALSTQLLGLGAVMLTDLALTGAPALRYLAERQSLSFGVGDWAVGLVVNVPLPSSGVLSLWWPLAAVAVLVLALAGIRHAQGLALAPVRAWVRCSDDPRWGAAQLALLVTVGAACVLFLGMPAAVSELLILLGCVGVASYAARQAPLANAGDGLQAYSLVVVLGSLLLAVGGALARGDLGHALVALGLASCFFWLFGGRWLRWVVLAVAALAVTSLVLCLLAKQLVGPLQWLMQVLPTHAQDRVMSMFAPFESGSSDLARTHWLMGSAGLNGWGVGYAPWQGLAPARLQEGLPLQGPSDYVLALTTTLWGQAGGLVLMGVVLAVFGGAAWMGLRNALRVATPTAVRWLAALGGFGCLVMAAKVVLSVGGVAGLLPLTGLPVGLLGYGPVTHLAALLYLSLALGTAHVQPMETVRGVYVGAQKATWGDARVRGLALALTGLVALAALLLIGFDHLRRGTEMNARHHVAKARMDMAHAVAMSLVPAGAPAAGEGVTCEELGLAVAAWNQQLGALVRPVRIQPTGSAATVESSLRLDLQRLLALMPVQGARQCRSFARTLGQMLNTDLARIVGKQSNAGPKAMTVGVFDGPRYATVRAVDYSTANAWWGQPGCVLEASVLASKTAKGLAKDAVCAEQAAGGAANPAQKMPLDIWLQRSFEPQLIVAARQPEGTRKVNHHPVAVGPALGLTLESSIQTVAQRTADCFTGRTKGGDCEAVLPIDATWRDRHFGDGPALRAGALGIVVSEVNTGRLVAMAGAISDCSLTNLAHRAEADDAGRMPALKGQSPCSQLPDRTSAWLAQQHPAMWMVPPGSSIKEFATVAGIDSKLITPGQDDYWKRILAESHEREPVQRIALASGQRYLDVLHGLGFGKGQQEWIWGGLAADSGNSAKDFPYRARWSSEAYAGTDTLRASSMSLEQAERIRKEKQRGINADKLHGEAVMQEFVAARRLADASVGGGDIRINALGLVNAWRLLDLRSRGADAARTLHLLEQPKVAVAGQPLDWMSTTAASRALWMTSGVAASAWKGTAQGSCRVVFGACPAQGIAGMSGKTGSSDFLTEEDSPHVKPGMQLPAKLFGGVFTAANGTRYAIAVMALRVREGDSKTLDLKSSAAAEAALTVMRQMGVDPRKP